MDELLKKAAAAIGMPPTLAERSAQARAEKEGTTVEAVLREWAGEDVDSASEAVGEPAETPAAEPEAAEPPPATAAAGPTEVTTDYLVALAAEAKRMPPRLVRSSAEARARNSQADLDDVLATWAGVDLADLAAKAEAGEPLPAVSAAAENQAPAEASEPDTAPEPTPEPTPTASTDATPETPAAAAPAVAAAAAATVSMDELLEKVAEAKGMPAPLAKRSAEARSKKTGEPVEAVLAEWAGIDPSTISSGDGADGAAAPEPAAPAAAPVAAAAAATITMDQLLEKVAEAKGMPAPLAKRSAQARSKKTGEPLEVVLAEWAGVDPASVVSDGEAPPAAAPAAAPTEAAPAEPAEDEAATVEVIEASTPAAAAEEAAEPELVGASRRGYPTWLAAAFILIPLLAVTYILVAPNGPDCGTAGQLKVDPATGLAVNCDGSEYGGSSVDYLAMGAGIYSQCAACHGAGGEGGVGPAFSGGAVLATFPAGQCNDHAEWVTLGTANFPEATYGATDKPVGGGGVMPGYEGSLSEEQIAAVSLYERVAFGGQPLEEAEVDCGLVEGEGEDASVEASAP